jgi:hypothetical protein
MKVVFADTLQPTDADIFIVDGSRLHDMRVKPPDTLPSTQQAPTVVLGERHVDDDFRGIGGSHAFHLHNPIGPKKLASALLNALALDVLRKSPHTTTVLSVVQTEAIEKEIGLQSGGFTQISVSQEELWAPTPATLHSAGRLTMLPAKRHVMVVDDNVVNSKVTLNFFPALK